jgi:hypothetical protein
MRRVKNQDEEGKGPGDQEYPGTRGPEDQGTRGPGDQRIRGTLNDFTSKFICVFMVLDVCSRKLRSFVQYHPHTSSYILDLCFFLYVNNINKSQFVENHHYA